MGNGLVMSAETFSRGHGARAEYRGIKWNKIQGLRMIRGKSKLNDWGGGLGSEKSSVRQSRTWPAAKREEEHDQAVSYRPAIRVRGAKDGQADEGKQKEKSK